jgi:hypothetical protein
LLVGMRTRSRRAPSIRWRGWPAERTNCDRKRPSRCRLCRKPFRETEGMLDGSDAVSDWALLNLQQASRAALDG